MRLPSAYDIADIYTLEQIDAKIASYQSALDGAMDGSYSLDSTQGRQSKTTSAPIETSTLLSIWIKARRIKAGTYEGTQCMHVNYTP